MPRPVTPSVHLRDVSFAHSAAVPVLSTLDLDLTVGWTGVVGPNGAGKSTLLSLLAGELSPDTGRVDVAASVPPVLLRQRVDTLDDHVRTFAGDWSGPAARSRSRLSLDPDDLERWPTLSPGQRSRWQLAAALAARPDVLLLDEPTNHLDADARALVLDALGRFDGVGVLVSHDRTLLDRVTTSTVRVLGPGAVDHRAGSYSAAREHWQQEEAHAAAAEQSARREERRLRRLRADARRDRQRVEQQSRAQRRAGADLPDSREAGRKVAAAAAERSLAKRVAALGSRVERAAAETHERAPTREAGALTVHRAGDRRRVLARVDAPVLLAGDHPVLRDVHVTVGHGDRIRVVGANGAGKTTLLRALVDAAPSVGTLPQSAPASDARAALDEVRGLDTDERGRVLGALAVLGVDPERVLATDAPSPGEARKLRLARLLVADHALLVLDEPTTHLDLPAVERLEEALADDVGALVLVTHDDHLAAATTTTTWTVTDGTVTTSSTP